MGAVLGAQAGGFFSKGLPTSSLRKILGLLIAGTALRTGYTLVGLNISVPKLLSGLGGLLLILILVLGFRWWRQKFKTDLDEFNSKAKTGLRS